MSHFLIGGAHSAPPCPPSQRAGGAAAPLAPPLPAPLSVLTKLGERK